MASGHTVIALALALWACSEAPEVSTAPLPAAAPAAPAPEVAPAADDALADDAAGLAAQLELAERAVRDPRWTDAEVRPHGHLQQRIYRQLGDDEALREAVLGAVPADLLATVGANTSATATSRATVRTPRVALPAWRITDPAPTAELLRYYAEAERAWGTPWEILAAIHLVETRMGRLHGLSTAGARGPMQFMPATWARDGQGYQDSDRDSILAAGRYLADVGVGTDPERAVWDYNHSDRYVSAVLGFASVMEAEPMTYRGYWSWEVYYLTTRGALHLPAGFALPAAVAVDTWCADHACPTGAP